MRKEWTVFAVIAAVFLVAYYLPLSSGRVIDAILDAFKMLQWYARNHTLACVVPAMFIAGAIATFLSKEAVLRHLGPKANKVESYGVASVSGTVLAVCSCSVLPMFAGIYRVGAGLGPASTFLYSGPAINIMAIFLTARVLGFDLGVARAVGAVVLSIVIGLLMAAIFRKDEEVRTERTMQLPDPPPSRRSLRQTACYFAAMLAFLVFSDWTSPSDTLLVKHDGTQLRVSVMQDTRDDMLVQLVADSGSLKKDAKLVLLKSEIRSLADADPDHWAVKVHHVRWYLAGACGLAVLVMLWRWFERDEIQEWLGATWLFARQIVPLLFIGVFITGFVAALLPPERVASLVGGNSFQANFLSSLIGAMWYFATLTEIPILQALLDLGMGQGPALALLLAGPALSVPSIVVIYTIVGFRKTAVFVGLVVFMSTLAGMAYGAFFG